MNDKTTSRWPSVAAFLLVLLVAAGLRLYRLPDLPLGLHYDEAANGILAGEIARGLKMPIFIPSYTGKEVLFFYWTALWTKLLGATPLALRLSGALIGLATVAATAWAVHELVYDRDDARWATLITTAFLATSFQHLLLSRYGFRAITQPFLQALTIAALWRGLRLPLATSLLPWRVKRGGASVMRTGGLPWLLLAGICCGLTAYTYLAARAFPIPLAAALLTLLVTDHHRRVRLIQLGVFAAVAALALAPLSHYWLTHPGSFSTRVQQIAAPSWIEAWEGIQACLGMFFLKGDPYIRFNLPQRPLFDPITAGLFLLGVGFATWRAIRSSHSTSRSSRPLRLASRVFLLTHLLVMLLPSALATGEITPSNLRTVGLLPFVYVFPALGLLTIRKGVYRFLTSSVQHQAFDPLLLACCLLLLVILTPITATAYFRDWAPSTALYHAADGDLVDTATYLNQTDLTDATPYVASVHYRHPTLAFLAEDYGAIRWLTGGRTLVFPAEGTGLLVFPHSVSEDLIWVQSTLPDHALVASPHGPDGMPAFHAYRIGEPLDVTPTHPLTANYGHIAELLGYDVVSEPHADGNAEIAVWWRVLNKPDRGDYLPVARLTDPWNAVWGKTQPFHYPSEQWTPGEVIVDHLSISVSPGAPPGDYTVRFSLYSPSADARLPVLDDEGAYAGTAVALPVRIERAASPAALADLDIRTHLDAHVGGLTLLGVNLNTTVARPGERLYLTLFWRADETPLPDYDVTLALDGAVLYAGAPVHSTYPTPEWTAYELVTDRYDPRIPRDFPPGDYALQLHLDDTTVQLGQVSVEATHRTFDIPPVSHPFTATLSDQVELLGYDLSPPLSGSGIAPGETLTLTLYWRASTEMEENYTVFTHLLAPDGSMSGQKDSQPVDGAYPTSLWLPGEVVTDVYEIPVSASAAPGQHRLEVGMYVAETGMRLSVENSVDDAITLQTINVTTP